MTVFLCPQCGEVFRALEQKAVYGPMSVIFFYNLLQVIPSLGCFPVQLFGVSDSDGLYVVGGIDVYRHVTLALIWVGLIPRD